MLLIDLVSLLQLAFFLFLCLRFGSKSWVVYVLFSLVVRAVLGLALSAFDFSSSAELLPRARASQLLLDSASGRSFVCVLRLLVLS